MPENWKYILELFGILYVVVGALVVLLISYAGYIRENELERIALNKPTGKLLEAGGIVVAIFAFPLLLYHICIYWPSFSRTLARNFRSRS